MEQEPKEKAAEEFKEGKKELKKEKKHDKKRFEKERQEFMKYANAELISELLPLLDSFELALKNAADKEKFVKGVEMIFAQFYSVLEKKGLRPISALGQKFDPYKHEVLLREKSEKDEDIILEELQKGYMLNDKVLRHTKVKVSQK